MNKSAQISELLKDNDIVDEHIEANGGKWSKEKRYLQVIEEYGELTMNILDNESQDDIEEELGDVSFTLLAYLDSFKELSFGEKRQIIKELNAFEEKDIKEVKELLMYFQGFLSLENKLLRKEDKRRNRGIELNTDIKIETNKYKIYFILDKIRQIITDKTMTELVEGTMQKYNNR